MTCTQCTHKTVHVCVFARARECVHEFFDSVYILLTIIYTNFNQPFCFFFPLLSFVWKQQRQRQSQPETNKREHLIVFFHFFLLFISYFNMTMTVILCGSINGNSWMYWECSDALEWNNNTFMHGERDSANEQYINISWPDRSVIRTIPCSCLSDPH